MTMWVWRHPRPQATAGRCIGQVDVGIDRRRAKRLAHRIRTAARRQQLPRVVWTSPLQRSHAVGRWLQRWGWQHRVEPALAEADFGAWDGRRWADIAQAEVDRWCTDFLRHAPGAAKACRRCSSASRRGRRLPRLPASSGMPAGCWRGAG
jgi:alpha-ribazole phosphatase